VSEREESHDFFVILYTCDIVVDRWHRNVIKVLPVHMHADQEFQSCKVTHACIATKKYLLSPLR